jgi:UDP-N-acetyl-D-mannosaminuronate dehydrogenase
MPSHVAGVLSDLMWNAGVPAGDARVLLLGWSYKAEVGDPRETPAEPLAETLMSKGIKVATWDPHIDFGEYPEGVEVISNIDDAEDFDIAVLVTAHKVCLNLDWDKLLSQMRTPLIYDGRRVLDLDSLEKMGWQTYAVGKPI